MKKSVQARREEVSRLLLKNLSETKISEILGVSRQTIVRDVFFLKSLSSDWLDGLAKNGFIFECKQALDKIKDVGRRLEELYDITDDVWQKISILRAIEANAKLYLEMLSEYPTLHAYKKALKITQNVSQA